MSYNKKVRFKNVCDERWRIEFIGDLVYKRDFKIYDDFNSKEIDLFLNCICCF